MVVLVVVGWPQSLREKSAILQRTNYCEEDKSEIFSSQGPRLIIMPSDKFIKIRLVLNQEIDELNNIQANFRAE